MSEELKTEAPRWPGGPEICEEHNLPRFETKAACKAWMEKNAPAVHINRIGLCRYCGGWHCTTTAPGPGGESSGSSRYHKGS